MAVLETVLATAGGVVSVTIGVVTGAVLTRRAQDRHWLRDKQLVAYQELLRQYATFAMILKRAHWDKSAWDYDWSVWSAALTSASLVAPADVAKEISNFARAIAVFLKTASVDTRTKGLTEAEFEQAMIGPGKAQLSLVNAIRRSLDRSQGNLDAWLGGSLVESEQ